MLLDGLLAEKRDGAHVLERPCGEACRHEALARVPEHQQLVAVERDRPEEAGLGVRHRLDLLRRDLVAEDVRHAREVRAAVQVPAVRREDEVRRQGGPPKSNSWTGVASPRQQPVHVEQAHGLAAVDLAERGRHAPAVRRHVEVVGHEAVGERDDPASIRCTAQESAPACRCRSGAGCPRATCPRG